MGPHKSKKKKDLEEVFQKFKRGQIKEQLAEHRPKVFFSKNPNYQKHIEFLKKMHDAFHAEILINQWKALKESNDITHLLPKIKSSTLVIHGAHDIWFDLEENQYIADHIKGAKLAIIEDAAHGTPIEQPQAVTALIRFFFSYDF